MRDKKLINIIIIFSILAIIISSYLLYIHYSTTGSFFCDLSNEFSCDIVNKSTYSEIFNIPVSLLSLLTFLFILLISFYIKKNREFSGFNKNELVNILIIFLIFSTLFSLYLVYIELFVLYSICILCVLLDIIIIILLITAIILKIELKLSRYIKEIK